MISKVKNIIFALAAVFALAAPALVPAAVYAESTQDQINSGLCAGTSLNTAATDCTADTTAATTKINKILSDVINIFSLIVGIVAVIMIIVGGLRYITSGGESSNVSSAKNTIIYAIVGLVIVALAQFIVHFVLGKVTAST